jgi:probable F420-dependent oxidoreductase
MRYGSSIDREFVVIRFGYQLGEDDVTRPVEVARAAESLGFHVVVVSDHVGPGGAPMVTLAAIAQATERIRLGTLVLNNDMRNPVQLAWEAATLDRLSAGRFELGLGAGHTPQEYGATGIWLDTPQRRKRRLCETVEVLRPLLDGEAVTYHGDFVNVDDAQVDATAQARVPILVGGNGSMLLEHAGAHADIVGLQGLGKTRSDGHNHAARWDTAHLEQQLDQVERGACARRRELELNALVQVATVTDDAATVLGGICERVDGLTIESARATPYLLVGTVDEIVEKVVRCQLAWGITYFVVRTLEEFAPVIAALQ